MIKLAKLESFYLYTFVESVSERGTMPARPSAVASEATDKEIKMTSDERKAIMLSRQE